MGFTISLYKRPVRVLGNLICAVPNRPGFDVYCMDPQATDTTPNIVVFGKATNSNNIEDKLTFRADYGFRDSKIAVTRREFGNGSQQASVYYQGYNGNLLEYRITRAGARSLLNVDNVPANTTRLATAPAMGCSLAATMTGADGQTVVLFYQAEDNKIYYVWQRAFGTWSLPTLVTNETTTGPSTLSAFSWTESDPNARTVIDCVCVAFNTSPGQFTVYMRRELRRPSAAGALPSSLRPNFEPVANYFGPTTRGPLSAVYATAEEGLPLAGQYKIYTQLLEDPSRIWAGTVLPGNNAGGALFQNYEVVVANTPRLRIPARGTSISTVYDPPKEGDKTSTGRMTVVYTSPEGLIAYREMDLVQPIPPHPIEPPYVPIAPPVPTLPPPVIPPMPGFPVDGVYIIVNVSVNVTVSLCMNQDLSVSVATNVEVSNGFSHLWLVEAKTCDSNSQDSSSIAYTLRNIATGATLQVDIGQKTEDGDEVNGREWMLTRDTSDDMLFSIQSKAQQTFIEDVLSDASQNTRSPTGTIPARPSKGSQWKFQQVSVSPGQIQHALDTIPHVSTGWARNRSYQADNHYIVIQPAQWEAIWKTSGLGNYVWTEELFDCDDFAVVFKGRVAEWGYKNIKTRKVGILCGLVCARARKGGVGHCFNFSLASNLKTVTFFEPQKGIFEAELIRKYEPTFGFW